MLLPLALTNEPAYGDEHDQVAHDGAPAVALSVARAVVINSHHVCKPGEIQSENTPTQVGCAKSMRL